MDWRVAYEKLESLRRCLDRIRRKRPTTAMELIDDHDLQDILSVNLERSIQLCVDLASMVIASRKSRTPQTMADCFEVLREEGLLSDSVAAQLVKSVGFRNIAVHSYRKIDWELVFQIVHNRLADFDKFAVAIAQTDRSSTSDFRSLPSDA